MKNLLLLLPILFTTCLHAQHFGFSSGLYRIPYANGTFVHVSHDVYDHNPAGKYDLVTEEENPVIVAAADGWVRWIQEDFDTSCFSPPCCWEFNNFVVIEHPNGEWSQYTHMDEGSTSAAGITLNQWVTAGTPLGTEGTVGCSSGDHLHFEVSRPFDPAQPFDTIGGFLNCLCSSGSNAAIAEMLIPVISGVSPALPWMSQNGTYVADDMDDNCITSLEVIGDLGNGDEYVARADASVLTDNVNTVTFSNGSSSIFRSGGYINLRPGFHILAGAKFTAIIKACNEQN